MNKAHSKSQIQSENVEETVTFLSGLAADTLKGLSANPKFLLSKYFYDNEGSKIFQEIMKMPEYYLTDCEMEILAADKEFLAEILTEESSPFNLIELGPGDGMKTRVLLKNLAGTGANFRFIPIDINGEENEILSDDLKRYIPSLTVLPRTGDYLDVIRSMGRKDSIRKIILFLGSNIGNLDDKEITLFLRSLSETTNSGDKVIMGFDLKKSPQVIMNAYDDPQGLTKRFNLNHLARLNRELDADFDTGKFEHHNEYNPLTGSLRSFLVSSEEQTVHIGALNMCFRFRQWEPVFMELSRKFDLDGIENLAKMNGFEVIKHLKDKRGYFVDSLWRRI